MILVKSSIFIFVIAVVIFEPTLAWKKLSKEDDTDESEAANSNSGKQARNVQESGATTRFKRAFTQGHSLHRRDTGNEASSGSGSGTQTVTTKTSSPDSDKSSNVTVTENTSGPRIGPTNDTSHGIGTAITKSESDQQQIQESGNKNTQEVIPMGMEGSPNGHRHEQSNFQKQTSSQRQKSETMTPVAIGAMTGYAQIPQMASMAAMPPMAAMQGFAPMPSMPDIPNIRMIRDISTRDIPNDFTNPDRTALGATGTGIHGVEEDPNSRNLEKREKQIAYEMPAVHAQSPQSTIITGPEVDDAFKG